ncbi:urease accessory protein UreF [Saccharothrix xinjiangensis]|uniref:Urease accessory protein UreF n=1 Tax=Saccharothrix xinjiangensis TaxID=204798 RepID=A0ABV9YDX7_9PSEU
MTAPDPGLAAVLSLADSRFPGGGHAHSGGVEEAVARGLVTDTTTLAAFLRGRLRTAGALAAAFTAAAAHTARHGGDRWRDLDAELDARTPSPAQRAASRAQGRGLVRAGRLAWPAPVFDDLLAATPAPHHPIALGALAGIAGAGAHHAALAAAYLSISGPASACVRLLGLDPFEANAAVTALSADLDRIAATAAGTRDRPPADLPAPGAPALDLFAEAHDRTHRLEVRLFAS